MTSTPLISVLVPVFNGMPYLPETVESIRAQTLGDFEVIALDDRSTDASAHYLSSVADSRLRTERLARGGLSAALNHGLEIARAPIVARIDADDVALPDRFRLQYDHLAAHPECVALGCQSLHVNEKGEAIGEGRYPTSPLAIRWEALFRSPILHPGSMYRREDVLAVGGYRQEFDVAEDYDLWTRLLGRGTLGNVPQQLLRYPVHACSVCSIHKEKQVRKARIAATHVALWALVWLREAWKASICFWLPASPPKPVRSTTSFKRFRSRAASSNSRAPIGIRSCKPPFDASRTVCAGAAWAWPSEAGTSPGRPSPGCAGPAASIPPGPAWSDWCGASFHASCRDWERAPSFLRTEPFAMPTAMTSEPVRQPVATNGERKLKVCLATLAPFIGGAEIAAERSALGLLRAGHDVFMLLGQRGAVGERFEKAGLCCEYASMRFTDRWHFWTYLRDRARLRSILQKRNLDVLHANDLPTHQAVAGAARGLPIARLCHHRQIFNGRAIAWFDKFGAHHHVFVSQALMNDLCTASPTLANCSRAVLYDGLDLPDLPTAQDKAAARRKLGLNPDRCQVLFAGQIIVRKGVADLLEAWAKLPPSLSGHADLLIVGEDLENNGAYRVEMAQLCVDFPCRLVSAASEEYR